MNILKRLVISVVIVCIAFALFYQFWFLRQPTRNIPHNNKLFISPANGTVVSVKKWNTESLVETKGTLGAISLWVRDVDTAGTIISIQMDPTNVHYQRAPIAGKVLTKKYVTGSFNNAIVMSNDYGIRFENEHNAFLMETENGKKYKVVQIAGFLARRIVDYTTNNQSVEQGDVIGLIKLGSQVTVILPHDVNVLSKPGDITIDGETILATEN